MEADLEDALNDCEEVRETNKHLEKVVDTLHSKTKDTENSKNAYIELEKDLAAFKTENNLLRENTKDLEFDLKKIKRDYLELTKKVSSQHNEYQESELERTVVEKRNLKKEEKKAKKKTKKEQKAGKREQKVLKVSLRSIMHAILVLLKMIV